MVSRVRLDSVSAHCLLPAAYCLLLHHPAPFVFVLMRVMCMFAVT
jgi:hypothetical protein